MAQHHREVERKYELADLAAQAPDISWESDHWQVLPAVLEDLDATYFDTPAGDLGRHKVALRRRLGGYDQGWHVKFDAAQSRHELTYDLLKTPSRMPAALKKLVQVMTSGAELQPRVSLKTSRKRTVLQDAQGRVLAEICDDQVLALDYATGLSRSWQEWEIELGDWVAGQKKLAKSLFEALEARLEQAGARPSASPAKIARALGQDADFEERLATLEGQAAPGHKKKKKKKKQSEAPQPLSSTALLVGMIDELAMKLAQSDLLVAAQVEDSTHQGRVVARQLRSVLKNMVLPYARSEQARNQILEVISQLKTYSKQLETHRNSELLLPLLAQTGAERALGQASHRALEELVAAQGQAGYRQAHRYLASSQRFEAHEALEELIRDLDLLTDLPLNAENYLNKVARRLKKNLLKTLQGELEAWPQDPDFFAASDRFDEGLHDTRKAAKAVRYCLGSFEEAGLPLTEDQQKLAKRARGLQALLGELTDQLTVSGWVRDQKQGALAAGMDPFELGYLAGLCDRQAATLRQDLYQLLPKASRKLEKIELR